MVDGLGCMAQGLGIKFWVLEFRVEGAGFKA